MTLEPQKPGIPLPSTTIVSAPYWQGCKQEELLHQKCTDCGAITMNPAPACSGCFGGNMVWEKGSGKGNIYSYTVVWRPQTPAFEVPYVPAIIELDEGYKLMSAIVGCEVEDVKVGMRVKVLFQEMSEEISLPYFLPDFLPDAD